MLLRVRIMALLIGGWLAQAAEFDHAHARFAAVLSEFVKDGRVDYSTLKARPGDLNAYLEAVAAVSASEFAAWDENRRLALLLNLYNAQTLKLIIDHYPLESIRSIGLLPGAAWRQAIVRFSGQTISLDHLEHQMIRAKYSEPRIHFALVCAAMGCPPLRDEPYLAQRLNDQLDDQTRRFLADSEKNRYDPEENTLNLSPIFDWYREDFTKPAGSLAAYVKPFLPAKERAALIDPASVKIRFTQYDWSLNDRKR